MFCALDSTAKRRVNLLNEEDVRDRADLRAKSRASRFACQACGGQVIVKLGEKKRAHFAHAHNANCPYKDESAELLDGRAALYQLLTRALKRPVEIEYRPFHGMPRGFDAYTKLSNGPVGYWIIDRNIGRTDREKLLAVAAKSRVVFLFTASTFAAGSASGQLNLSTTHREFMDRNNRICFRGGGRIIFLDGKSGCLYLWRELVLRCGPQAYSGTVSACRLENVLVSETTGDLYTQKEAEACKVEAERKLALEHAFEVARKAAAEGRTLASLEKTGAARRGHSAEPLNLIEREGVCRYCAKVTTSWTTHDGESGFCTCAECSRSRSGSDLREPGGA